MPPRVIEDFLAHWSAASPSERANSQPFLLDLCDVLGVPRPDPHPDHGYFFEFPVTEHHPDGTSTQGRIDLYRRARFVLESKQFQAAQAAASRLELAAAEAGVLARKKSSQPTRGTEAWDEAMIKARGQAERYVRALPATEPNPPFLIVADVGHSFEVFADFTQAGKAYLPFPDPRSFRIRLADLADEKIRERLRLIWTDPAALDPAKHSAEVTRQVSSHLAELAKSLEEAGHEPDVVAQFLTRCLFCMFAEDIELLPKGGFTELLESLPPSGEGFVPKVRTLFAEMQQGTEYSVVLNRKLLRFNGGLFEHCSVLPLNSLQLGLLKNAARQQWASVEPAIFGTLLERALNPAERHQLGAHFTPRAYVERLVLPTVIEPLRAEWANVRAAALTHARAGDLPAARAEVNAFHERLCQLVVLDPACGCGNFLYVALQQLKVLEGEVLDVAAQFGENFKLELATHTVDPHQFLGLEINPRAAAIAELVLWIGYLQWHFKLHGQRTPPEPILRAFQNIQCRDAVLQYDAVQEVTWQMAQENPDLPGLPDSVRVEAQRLNSLRAVPPHPGPLPPGEGNATTRARTSDAPDSTSARPPFLPLPAGEGRGEGEATPCACRADAPDSTSARPSLLPLPAGEGRGEGENSGKPETSGETAALSRAAATPPAPIGNRQLEIGNAPLTVWDRHSLKTDPVTGREVPDETRRVPLLAYLNPRPAEWPAADFIVGNPPFIGTARMRADLGDGYAETLRAAYPEVPESADFVLYWWHKAAGLVRAGQARRFGFITTNSLRQTFARRVVQYHLDCRSRGNETLTSQGKSPRLLTSAPTEKEKAPLSLVFAIPDHPWVDTAEGAAVRIAMTVGVAGEHRGELLEVTAEHPQADGSEQVEFRSQRGKISADLTIGADVSSAVPLKANEGLVSRGVQTIGEGFVVAKEKSQEWMATDKTSQRFLRPFLNGKDLTASPREVWVIDFFGSSQGEAMKGSPTLYQHLLVTVKPERDQSKRDSYRKNWWILGEPQPMLRRITTGLARYIVSPVTAKHRFFVFLGEEFLADQALNVFAFDDALFLGVLSSRIHVVFALAAGGRLGVGNDPRYNKSRCFDPFPFPLCGEAERGRIRALAEELDAHRKRVQAQHPGLTLTGLYNVLEKLRSSRRQEASLAAATRTDLPHPIPLPLGEGTAALRARETNALDSGPALAAPLPLPAGEGRGEGERHQPPTAPPLLTAKERAIHDQGLVSVLKQLHDDLDAAVFAAYGWPATLTDAEILERLVTLNAARAAEEARGVIHWLRPEYQTRNGERGTRNRQETMELPEAPAKTKAGKTPHSALRTPRLPWPKALAARVQAVEAALHQHGTAATPAELAALLPGAPPGDVAEILETLVTLGRARQQGEKFMR